jgi:hypothetical protein
METVITTVHGATWFLGKPHKPRLFHQRKVKRHTPKQSFIRWVRRRAIIAQKIEKLRQKIRKIFRQRIIGQIIIIQMSPKNRNHFSKGRRQKRHKKPTKKATHRILKTQNSHAILGHTYEYGTLIRVLETRNWN